MQVHGERYTSSRLLSFVPLNGTLIHSVIKMLCPTAVNVKVTDIRGVMFSGFVGRIIIIIIAV